MNKNGELLLKYSYTMTKNNVRFQVEGLLVELLTFKIECMTILIFLCLAHLL